MITDILSRNTLFIQYCFVHTAVDNWKQFISGKGARTFFFLEKAVNCQQNAKRPAERSWIVDARPGDGHSAV